MLDDQLTASELELIQAKRIEAESHPSCLGAVSGRSEQFFCYEYDGKGLPRCAKQCTECDYAEGGK